MISISMKDFEAVLCKSWVLDVHDQRIDRLLTLWTVAYRANELELYSDIDFLMDTLTYRLATVEV